MKLLLPQEHGSWAVLAVPVFAGFAAARGAAPVPAFLFCCAALGAFLTRAPVMSLYSGRPDPAARTSLVAFGSLALSGSIPLLAAYGRWWLLGFAAPACALLAADLLLHGGKRSMSALSELSGIAILCLGAPAACYAAAGTANADAWGAWLLCAAFFAGPVFHVKMAALQHRTSADRSFSGELARMRRVSAVYHALAAAAVVFAAQRRLVPAAAVMPFAAALAKTVLRGGMGPGKVDFKRLGYQEVAYSLFFLGSLAAGYLIR